MKLRPMKVTVVVANGRRLGHRVWRGLSEHRLATENGEWVRGHVREGTPAGDALLAAYALAPTPRVSSRQFNFHSAKIALNGRVLPSITKIYKRVEYPNPPLIETSKL